MLTVLAGALLASSAIAGDVRVAVAANFTNAANELGAVFNEATAHRARFRFGSTGQLYAQIANGAPYDVFMAADQARPSRAIEAGFARAQGRLTYALGRLVLYSADPSMVTGEATLRDARFDAFAIANPQTAPYGAAAIEVLERGGALGRLTPALVRGNSVAQTYQFVATGNASAGLVALSQVIGHQHGSRWLVPAQWHAPIAQDAVLLSEAADAAASRAFLDFLASTLARSVIERHGYTTRAGVTQ